ncbi:hypothetical protein PIB30_072284 [Stylosanthes scabra]|uniref:Uncharacterized protein n=1 Tax=Stylosanthes scabra TaxID=79078 RepID=A0ABU6ZMR4_9FABA|nr:hypothetical protein [Stylosanthes scabra]
MWAGVSQRGVAFWDAKLGVCQRGGALGTPMLERLLEVEENTGRRSKPSTISLEANFNPRRKIELRGLLPPPPISLELRGNHPHH